MISRALFLLVALLTAPTLIFCLSLMQPLPGSACALALALALATLARRVDWRAPPDGRAVAICLALGLAACLIGGHGHFLYQTDDWIVRDAVLVDLIRNDWPVSYIWNGYEPLTVLRAPLGMYLAPALVGKAFGMRAGDLALLAQNALMLALVLLVVSRAAPEPRDRWLTVGFFLMFSGVDVVPWLLLRLQGAATAALPHMEIWNGHFQYSSHMTQMIWAPNHALAGWAFVAGYESWRRGALPATGLAIVFAGVLFWSPLVAMGALPFLAMAGVSDLARRRMTVAGFGAAALAAASVVPVAIYLTRGSGEVEQHWTVGETGFAMMYVLFLAFEVGPFAALLARDPDSRGAKGSARAELILLAFMLAAIPLYLIGGANDFAMRASIPALAILSLRAAGAFARAWRRDRMADQRWVLIALVLALATPLSEIGRNLAWPGSPLSACNLEEANEAGPMHGDTPVGPVALYVADASAFAKVQSLFRQPAGAPERFVRRACWSADRPFVFGKH